MVELRPFLENAREEWAACRAAPAGQPGNIHFISAAAGSQGHRFSPSAPLWRRPGRRVPVTPPGSDGTAGRRLGLGAGRSSCSQAEDAGLRFGSWETCLCVCVPAPLLRRTGGWKAELPGKCIPSALAPKSSQEPRDWKGNH